MSARSGALRRRRKPSLATRLRIFWIFIAAVAGALGYLVYVVITLPALRVHAVDVSIEGLAVTQAQVLQAADIDRNANVWLLDTARVARRIEAIPYVDTATVRRSLPARISIAVSEREPAACVRAGSERVTIDAQRRILQSGCARSSVVAIALPQSGLGAAGSIAAPPALAGLLADDRALRAAGIRVQSLGLDRFGELEAVQSDGIRLLIGSDADIAAKAKLIAPVLAATRAGRPIRAIDLRAPATPTVVFR